jgi:selenocysteine-specific elongation factor
MAQLIGTAGHVDHGKTSLIKALTGIDADRLPEEKKRGLTIDIGFAAIDLPEVGRVSIVDVPGHEKFVGNMLVGALGMDVVLLCVAADSGVMPQTEEHFSVIKLLPVDHLVVAVTRADLADADTIEVVRLQIADLFAGTRFESAEMIPVSAVTGSGLEKLRSELVRLLKLGGRAKEGPWYLPIDRVFTRPGFGTVVTGTLARGRLKVGEPAVIYPSGQKTRAKGIHTHGASAGEVGPGQRVALNLAGVGVDEVHRGDAVGEAGSCFASDLFDARVEWLDRPAHSARVRVSIGSDEVMAKVFHNDHDLGLVQIRCERRCAVARNQPLIVRSYSPPRVLGGGMVTVPEARKRRKNVFAGELGSASESDLVQIIHSAPFGIMTVEVARLLGKSLQEIGDEIEQSKNRGEILGFAGLWFTGERFREATEQFLAALNEMHRAHPEKALLPREQVAKAADIPWRGKPLDRLIAHWVHERELRGDGTNIAQFDHRPELAARQRSLLDRVKQVLESEAVSVPGQGQIVEELRVPKQAIDEILRIGIDAGELVRIGDGLIYTESQLGRLKDEVRTKFGGQRFSAGEFKDAFGTSRKYAIPLLEYFDSVNVTMRQGDTRVVL